MQQFQISIHAPLRGRRAGKKAEQRRSDFNPRPLAGATLYHVFNDNVFIISIHAPLRGRRRRKTGSRVQHPISIHAPLRGRRYKFGWSLHKAAFQSTPPCGGDSAGKSNGLWPGISIHAPLRGRLFTHNGPYVFRGFQSTPPCGGDVGNPLIGIHAMISIHAPLRGRRMRASATPGTSRISIHAPLRGRRRNSLENIVFRNFNPRPLAGATNDAHVFAILRVISIHAPLRGRLSKRICSSSPISFQSTPPCGGDLTTI